jgi:phosphatidylglycerol:prolipoprotein diacylglycerol transferase
MRSILFIIPHEFLGFPLFGFGWVVFGLILALIARWIWGKANQEKTESFLASLPTWGILCLVVMFLFPRFEMIDAMGNAVGIPIRGYGVMLLLGLVSGIGLAIYRGSSLGIHVDTIIALAFWIFCGGILGARAFYVIQKWEEFAQPTTAETLWKILQFTEGGLVVFGGLIGALIAVGLFAYLRKLPWLPLGDLIVPSFLVGQSIGRIGCLLNGCCFGGVCDTNLPAIYFPHGSPPYAHQLMDGELLGMKLTEQPNKRSWKIDKVTEGSIAAKMGWQPGSLVSDLNIGLVTAIRRDPTLPPTIGVDLKVDGLQYSLGPKDLPKSSLPTVPAQIYSAIDAGLLAMVLWWLFPLVNRDVIIFGLGLGLHGVSRFLLEIVRSDEGGQFGTDLTISQWISLGMILVGCVILARAYRYPSWKRPLLGRLGTFSLATSSTPQN